MLRGDAHRTVMFIVDVGELVSVSVGAVGDSVPRCYSRAWAGSFVRCHRLHWSYPLHPAGGGLRREAVWGVVLSAAGRQVAG